MLLAVHYRVMEHVGSLESTQEARVALSYHLGQLLRFLRAGYCQVNVLHLTEPRQSGLIKTPSLSLRTIKWLFVTAIIRFLFSSI